MKCTRIFMDFLQRLFARQWVFFAGKYTGFQLHGCFWFSLFRDATFTLEVSGGWE
jgi:hypothetical protein